MNRTGPRVAVTFPVLPSVRTIFGRAFDARFVDSDRVMETAELLTMADRCECLIVATTHRLDRLVLEALPKTVRIIGTYSVGTDHIDLTAATALSIAVLNTPDVLTEAVAEVGMFLMIGAARRATESIDLIRSRQWRGWTPTQLPGVQLAGKRLGIVGMGRIGRALALRARAFGMSVHYHNRRRLSAVEEAGAVYHATLGELLEMSQFLALTCPATPDTVGLIDAAAIAALPAGAIIVNIARGNVVQDEALIAALRSGQVLAAGLDVFDREPLLDDRYFALPNVFMTPHIGSSTLEAREQMAHALVEGVRQILQGVVPDNRVA
ncbi:MAG TPA: D-glycerate dehydrogenase [Steroidobacteraceae bacterium]|jgi:lactate dehydrogenase-like 2-hydroxyacid dehydrogenase|nr:D-glycerate dehydrogenase [Steroidobacteraceae bacterium]